VKSDFVLQSICVLSGIWLNPCLRSEVSELKGFFTLAEFASTNAARNGRPFARLLTVIAKLSCSFVCSFGLSFFS
jgi:hypothetical protein